MVHRRPDTEAELAELVRSIDVRAPDALHRSVQRMIDERGARRAWPRRVLGPLQRAPRPALALAALGALAVAAAVALALVLAGSARPTLTLRQTAALTLLRATAPAPHKSAAGAELAVAVDGLSFPYWEDALGWRAVGSRADVLAGRSVTTVFYSNARGRTVGYAIVAGLPAPRLGGGQVIVRGGVTFRLLNQGGARVVAWLRAGHLCVITGRGVPGSTLLRLASWGVPLRA